MLNQLLHFGSNNPTKFYGGATEVQKMYWGSNLVWEVGSSSGSGGDASYGYVENLSTNYPFNKNSSNYYESSNKGVHSTYSLAKVHLHLASQQSVIVQYISSGENNYDFGIFSNIDTTLVSSNTADTSNVFKSCKGEASTTAKTITYTNVPAGDHFFYAKYRKDSSQNDGNDSLQFRITNVSEGAPLAFTNYSVSPNSMMDNIPYWYKILTYNSTKHRYVAFSLTVTFNNSISSVVVTPVSQSGQGNYIECSTTKNNNQVSFSFNFTNLTTVQQSGNRRFSIVCTDANGSSKTLTFSIGL